MTTKTCTGCLKTKEASAFAKRTRSKDGLQFRCRDCQRGYRDENRDQIADRGRTYRSENREEIAARKRAYERENAEAIAARKRVYYQANSGKIAATARAWALANPTRQQAHLWRGNYLRRMREFGLAPVVEEFDAADVISAYGDRCFHCETGAFEELDHFPVPVHLGGPHTLANVKPCCVPCNGQSWRLTP